MKPQLLPAVITQLRSMFFPTKEPHVPKPKAVIGTPVQVSVNHRRRFIRQLAIEQRTTTKRAGKRFDRPNGHPTARHQRIGVMG